MSKVPSPCIRECKIDDLTQVCTGCGRDLMEIVSWSRFTAEERGKIMERLFKEKTKHE